MDFFNARGIPVEIIHLNGSIELAPLLGLADRMLDLGFKPTVDRIVAMTPRKRQTLFLSATLEGAAGKQAREHTRDARRHVYEPPAEDTGKVQHRFVHLSREAKVATLMEELGHSERRRTLVFVRTKRGADRLARRLEKQHVHAVAMHGNRSQSQRQKALAGFAQGSVDVLVATDVAARGLDLPDLDLVIHADLPQNKEMLVHRSGRTGRAGKKGLAIIVAIFRRRRSASVDDSDLLKG
jgi:superfamily II DNA/RNA helicase